MTPQPKQQFIRDVDGSTRCRACHLHPDQCTCSPNNPMWEIMRAAGFPLSSADRNADPTLTAKE